MHARSDLPGPCDSICMILKASRISQEGENRADLYCFLGKLGLRTEVLHRLAKFVSTPQTEPLEEFAACCTAGLRCCAY